MFIDDNNIKELTDLPSSLHCIEFQGNSNLKNISAIWKCENLKYIDYDQPWLDDELKIYSKITSCAILYNR